MAEKQELIRLRKVIRKDSRLLRLESAFDRLPEYNLNVKELYDEVKSIHLTRKTRQLNRKDQSFVQDITEGLIDDQAQRSRVSEILMSCIHLMKNFGSSLDNLEGYLLLEYASQLSVIRTKGERQAFMRHNILKPYLKYIDRVSRVREGAEIVIVDIDKAGFMYKNLIESVKLSTGNREML